MASLEVILCLGIADASGQRRWAVLASGNRMYWPSGRANRV